MTQHIEHLTLAHGLITGVTTGFVPVFLGDEGVGTDEPMMMPGVSTAAGTVNLGPLGTTNLLITCAGGGNTVTITADLAVLANSTNQTLLVTSVSVTPDITLLGAGGLDTGSVAATNQYYLWLIAKADGTTSAVYSVSSSAPTMPAGYTFKLFVGANRTDINKHTTAQTQIGRTAWVAQTNVFTNTAGPATYTSQSVNTIVPIVAKYLLGICGNSTFTGHAIAIAGDTSGTGENLFIINAPNVTLDGYSGTASPFRVPMITAQTFYWKTSNTGLLFRVDVTGWEYGGNLG